MSGSFDLGNYKEVDERVREWYEKYPNGRIVSTKPEVVQVGDKSFISVTASVYRTPDDPVPCIASAWEPWPGKTTYTKDSEMMNAETSAWGRALAAAGLLAKGEKVASCNEVRNRRTETNGAETAPSPPTTSRASSSAPPSAPTAAVTRSTKTASEILDEARSKLAKPGTAEPDRTDAVCPSCGRSSALRPDGNPRFCMKKEGGCGFPNASRGEVFSLISYGEWLDRQP